MRIGKLFCMSKISHSTSFLQPLILMRISVPRLLTWLLLLLLTSYLTLKLLFLPSYPTALTYNSQTISIFRDQNNIPHVSAKTKNAAYYGLGYVMAEDRLFQMHVKRMLTNGRLSEMFGEKSLGVDRMFKTVNMGGLAREAGRKWKEENPETYQIYQDYANGINDCVKRTGVLPLDFWILWLDFHDWTVEDCLTINYLLNWAQSFDYIAQLVRSVLTSNHTRQQIDKILPFKESFFLQPHQVIVNDQQLKTFGYYQSAYQRNTTHIQFHPEQITSLVDLGINSFMQTLQVGASNSWVISGKLTQSGKPILANDPHLETSIPSQWYQFEMEYERDHKKHWLKGAGITGGLSSIIGKTGYFAWGCTNVITDTQDLYKEKLDDAKLHYLYNGEWRKLQIREETIKVRGGQDVKYNVRSTHRGPIMQSVYFINHLYQVKQPLSLAWSAAHSRYQFAIQAMNFMQIDNFHSLKKTLTETLNDAPPMNLVFITNDGHIGLQTIGSYPIMNNQAEESGFVKDGTTSKHDWIGMLKGKDRMFINDPEKGYIVTANNRLASSNFRGGRYQSNWMITARAIRITEMIQHKLRKGHKLTVGDSKKIQLDTVDYFCKKMLPHLETLGNEFRKAFEFFNCNFTSQSVQASVYSMFMLKLQKKINPGDFPLEGVNAFNHYTYRYLLQTTTESGKQLENVKNSLKEAQQELKKFFGTESDWPWGKLHRDHMEHRPFSRTPLAIFYERNFPGRGNENTANVALMRKLGNGNFETNHRAGIRMVLTFEPGQSEWIIDSGASQSVLSKYYDDQYSLFKDDQYLKFDSEQQFTAEDL